MVPRAPYNDDQYPPEQEPDEDSCGYDDYYESSEDLDDLEDLEEYSDYEDED